MPSDKKLNTKKNKKSTVKMKTIPCKRSIKSIVSAIKGTGGIVTTIAEKLQCAKRTVYNYIDKYDDVRIAIEEEKDTILDICEEGLFAKIYSQDFDAIKYYLERKGKSRGYGGQDQFGKGPNDIPAQAVVVNLFDKDSFPEGYFDAGKV